MGSRDSEEIFWGWPSVVLMKIKSIFHIAVSNLKDRRFANMTTAIGTALLYVGARLIS